MICRADELEQFERTAVGGSRLVYFTGLLARDLQHTQPLMVQVVNRVRTLNNRGYVDLVQRRLLDGEMEYWAIWRAIPSKEASYLPLIPCD